MKPPFRPLWAGDELLESVCNESSEGLSHRGGGLNEAEQQLVEVAPETLAKYVGTYEGVWLGRQTTIIVRLEDGTLSLLRDPPYLGSGTTEAVIYRLVPVSDNTFECSCGLGFIFTAEGDGMASELSEVHVSGGWTFTRVP